MPEKQTLERARRDERQGKAPSTQAGEFVREEIHHIREGKHGAASAKQAIAIGLSKARRAGVKLRPPAKGRVSEKTRRSAASAYRKGQRGIPTSPKRSQARSKALRREGRAHSLGLSASRGAGLNCNKDGVRAASCRGVALFPSLNLARSLLVIRRAPARPRAQRQELHRAAEFGWT